MRWASLRFGWLDTPTSSVKTHRVATPSLGGAGIYLADYAGAAIPSSGAGLQWQVGEWHVSIDKGGAGLGVILEDGAGTDLAEFVFGQATGGQLSGYLGRVTNASATTLVLAKLGTWAAATRCSFHCTARIVDAF